jgi:hypothetical protein
MNNNFLIDVWRDFDDLSDTLQKALASMKRFQGLMPTLDQGSVGDFLIDNNKKYSHVGTALARELSDHPGAYEEEIYTKAKIEVYMTHPLVFWLRGTVKSLNVRWLLPLLEVDRDDLEAFTASTSESVSTIDNRLSMRTITGILLHSLTMRDDLIHLFDEIQRIANEYEKNNKQANRKNISAREEARLDKERNALHLLLKCTAWNVFDKFVETGGDRFCDRFTIYSGIGNLFQLHRLTPDITKPFALTFTEEENQRRAEVRKSWDQPAKKQRRESKAGSDEDDENNNHGGDDDDEE